MHASSENTCRAGWTQNNQAHILYKSMHVFLAYNFKNKIKLESMCGISYYYGEDKQPKIK